MFGYLPDQYLNMGPERIDLKKFRYGHMRDAVKINALLTLHRIRLS